MFCYFYFITLFFQLDVLPVRCVSTTYPCLLLRSTVDAIPPFVLLRRPLVDEATRLHCAAVADTRQFGV